MRKHIIKVILSVLLVCTVLCGAVLSAGAVRAPRYIGDVDWNGSVTVLDATRIQRWLAGLADMTKLDIFAADVNGDSRTDILDATRIQRKLAGLGGFYDDDKSVYDYYFGYYIEDWRFYADYDSGKARAGTPVTFHAEALCHDSPMYGNPQEPLTYEFYIGNKLVQERSGNNELVYTFAEPGTYRVHAVMYNAFDDTCTAAIQSYRVVEPYSLDRPVIVSTLFMKDTHSHTGRSPLTVRAEGGEGPYQYMYTAEGYYDGYENDGFFIEEPVDEYSPIIISTGYIDSNVFTIPRGLYASTSPIPEQREAALIIYARDSKGNVSNPVTVTHRVRDLIE